MATEFSFEFFPPKSEAGADALWSAAADLATLKPRYMTVTYGAGGGTRDGTLEAVTRIAGATKIPMAAHLTFINTQKAQLQEYVGALWEAGIHHLVALRGDMPKDLNWPLDLDGDYFQYTSDFVEGLKTWHDFEISVGCYPEKHPDAPSLAADITALKKKCEAGADRAITQFFFDNDVYYRFVEDCVKAGITTPIIPGLLPIHDFAAMCKFAARCQASVPDWLHNKFAKFENDPQAAQELAIDLLARQTQDLVANGAPHIHYYTLNKAAITKDAIAQLG